MTSLNASGLIQERKDFDARISAEAVPFQHEVSGTDLPHVQTATAPTVIRDIRKSTGQEATLKSDPMETDFHE